MMGDLKTGDKCVLEQFGDTMSMFGQKPSEPEEPEEDKPEKWNLETEAVKIEPVVLPQEVP